MHHIFERNIVFSSKTFYKKEFAKFKMKKKRIVIAQNVWFIVVKSLWNIY